MDRLTYYDDDIVYSLSSWEEVKNRLAAYEDLGTVEELAELVKAKNDGRCVVLPCTIGDTVYFIKTLSDSKDSRVIEPFEVCYAIIGYSSGATIYNEYSHRLSVNNFGVLWFLTREEAEAKLREENA